MKYLKNKITIMSLLLSNIIIQSYDVLIEGKGAYFLATDQTFKQTYNNGCWEFGLEGTAQIINHIYGFMSVDLFNKNGQSHFFQTPSKFHSTNFGIGIKYFMPFDKGDFYIGLGATPTYLRTIDYPGYALQNGQLTYLSSDNDYAHLNHKTERWGFGGITKFGVILNLAKNFFINMYIDYQFTHMKFSYPQGNFVQSTKAILDGAMFGVGFGYRFN